MTQNLPIRHNPAVPPSLPTKDFLDRVSIFRNRLRAIPGKPGASSISDQEAPSVDDRRALQRRAGELSASLQPGDRNEIAQAISQVFLAYQQMKLAPSEAKATIALYVSQVGEFPIWAVRQGCEAIIRRPSQWPPSAGEVRTAVEASARAARDERAAIAGILTAEITHEPSEDDRERIKRGFAELVGELGGKVARPSERTKADAEVWLEQQKANPTPLPKLSGAALRACGVDVPTHDDMRDVI